MARGGPSFDDWKRRRERRQTEETRALRIRCPICGAAPGIHCGEQWVHIDRRMAAALDQIEAGK